MSTDATATDWQAEYDFYRKIIEDEVARLRWNQGFEPLEAELYKSGRRWIGRTRICYRDFRVTATDSFDSRGRAILKVSVHALAR